MARRSLPDAADNSFHGRVRAVAFHRIHPVAARATAPRNRKPDVEKRTT
jgi:hypothetical protein